MGIAEDLKTLDELHVNGKLTDAEFSAGKASALNIGQKSPTKSRRLSPVLVVSLTLLVLLLLFAWYFTGTKQTGRMLATVVHAPITLQNEIENVPASSWKAIPFTTSYAGTVTINFRTVRGDPLDVFVVDASQLDTLKTNKWDNNLRTYTDFNAEKTRVYQRSARLRQGSYYLVLRDTSLGILSSSTSDVSIDIELKP